MLVSEMISEIQDHGFEDLSSARILGWLNDTYLSLCAEEPWPFLEATATPTVNASGLITAPTDINKVLSLTDTSTGTVLIPKRANEFTKMFASNLSLAGSPAYYYYLADSIFIYPIPTTATLNIKYIKVPAALTVSPDSSPIFPSAHHRLVVVGALVKAYAMEDDPEQAAAFMSMYDAQYQKMRQNLWIKWQYDRPDNIEDVFALDDVYDVSDDW